MSIVIDTNMLASALLRAGSPRAAVLAQQVHTVLDFLWRLGEGPPRIASMNALTRLL